MLVVQALRTVKVPYRKPFEVALSPFGSTCGLGLPKRGTVRPAKGAASHTYVWTAIIVGNPIPSALDTANMKEEAIHMNVVRSVDPRG